MCIYIYVYTYVMPIKCQYYIEFPNLGPQNDWTQAESTKAECRRP